MHKWWFLFYIHVFVSLSSTSSCIKRKKKEKENYSYGGREGRRVWNVDVFTSICVQFSQSKSQMNITTSSEPPSASCIMSVSCHMSSLISSHGVVRCIILPLQFPSPCPSPSIAIAIAISPPPRVHVQLMSISYVDVDVHVDVGWC